VVFFCSCLHDLSFGQLSLPTQVETPTEARRAGADKNMRQNNEITERVRLCDFRTRLSYDFLRRSGKNPHIRPLTKRKFSFDPSFRPTYPAGSRRSPCDSDERQRQADLEARPNLAADRAGSPFFRGATRGAQPWSPP
jgi:hypothetical protein